LGGTGFFVVGAAFFDGGDFFVGRATEGSSSLSPNKLFGLDAGLVALLERRGGFRANRPSSSLSPCYKE